MADAGQAERLDLPAQPLGESLQQVAERFDLKIAFYNEFTDGLHAPPLRGDFTSSEAFDALLADTPLEHIYVVRTTVAVRPRAAVATTPEGEPTMNRKETRANERRRTRTGAVRGFVAGLAATLLAGPGQAQDEGELEEQETAEKREVFVEEIIVTAEKREESILDVPMTLSAFSEESISELGMTNNDDLEQLTPGLQIGNQAETVGNGIVIRGIGTQKFGETHADLAVANYVDGVYTLSTSGAVANLFDVERVEVARGPQGTLHGRNSIAGSISYFTRKPTDQWNATALVELTDQYTQRLSVAGGGPITDKVFFRLRASDFSGDGAQENIGLGGDWDKPDELSLNAQLRFKTDRFDVNVGYTDYEDTGAPRGMLYLVGRPRDDPRSGNYYKYFEPIPSVAKCPGLVFTGGGGANDPDISEGGFYICDDLQNVINSNRPGVKDNTREALNWTADWHLTDTLLLRYTGSDSVFRTVASRDADGTNRYGNDQGLLSFFGGLIPQDCIDTLGAANCLDVRYSDAEQRSVWGAEEKSHELQLFTDFHGPVNFIAGVYFYESATDSFVNAFDFGGDQRWRGEDPTPYIEAASPIFGFFPVATCEDYQGFLSAVLGWGRPGEIVSETGCGTIFPEVGEDTRSISFARAETRAGFLHADWRVTENLRLSGGLRYTEDEKENTRLGFQTNFLIFGIPTWLFSDTVLSNKDNPAYVPVGTWDAWIWNIGLEYTTAGDDLLYGRISTGYRPGAPNQGCCTREVLKTVAEETLVNYELGFKGLLLDDRLQVTTAAFYIDYDGYQINGAQELPLDFPFSPQATTPVTQFTANVEGTKIWGAEVNLSWYLAERWRISGYYAYTDSELGSHRMVIPSTPASSRTVSTIPFPRLDLNPASPWRGQRVCTPEWVAANGDYDIDGAPSCFWIRPNDVTGNQLPQQPNHKWALTLAYAMDLQNLTKVSNPLGSLQLLGTYSRTGERFPDWGNWPDYVIPSYGRFDLRAAWTSPQEKWNVTFYVQNVLDDIGLVEFYVNAVLGRSRVVSGGTLTEPRQFGLTVRAEF